MTNGHAETSTLTTERPIVDVAVQTTQDLGPEYAQLVEVERRQANPILTTEERAELKADKKRLKREIKDLPVEQQLLIKAARQQAAEQGLGQHGTAAVVEEVPAPLAIEPIHAPEPEPTPEPDPEPIVEAEPETEPQIEQKIDLIVHAKRVEDDELVREPGNNGKPLDEGYVENQTRVREYFVDGITDGSLYENQTMFTLGLADAHTLAADGHVYQRVGGGHLGLVTAEFGLMRSQNMIKRSHKAADKVAMVAHGLGDPYASRFHEEGVMKVNLEGVDSTPSDNIVDGRYLFSYPDYKTIPQYMHMAQTIGQEIEDVLRQPVIDTDRAVELIGRQYQYLVSIRPFNQINNSLFMNLANAQLKLAGLDGIRHGELDSIAHHIQPDNFVKYFKRRVAVGQQAQAS